MTDQDAYRRYTAEAEKLLKLAETPIIVTLPDTATEAEASTFLTQVKAKFQREDIVMMSDRSELNTSLIVATAAVWATLALAAAQDRVQPADRPTDHQGIGPVDYIVVNNELVKPTQAAYAHQVVMRDDRGRPWRIVAGDNSLHWEAVPV